MKIIIIGSKGFVGSACVAKLASEHDVIGADIVLSSEPAYIHISNKGSLEDLFKSNLYDVCINASGSANVGFSFANVQKDHELNVDNVKVMLDAIATFQPSCKFINFSSAAVYGNPISLPIGENSATTPLSPYGQHKLESEKLLHASHTDSGLSTCSLRVFSAYGPRLYKQLFWDIFQKWKNTSSITLFGTGNESRDFIFIDDLIFAVESVIKNAKFHGEVINVASGKETTIRLAASMFLDILAKPYELSFSGEEKPGDPINWCADITTLKAIGFVPVVDLETGLRATVLEYLASGK